MTYPIDPELVPGIPMFPDLDLTDPAAARRLNEELMRAAGTPDPTGVAVTEQLVDGPAGAPGVRLRLYRPQRVTAPAALYNVHGGGFVLGDLESDHARLLELARELGVLIVSVEYRLAPEHPFPAGLEDCYAGLAWLAEHAAELRVDPERIAVHGISAGGGLCAALALLARDRGGPGICFQYLGVPEVDDRLTTASMRQFVDTPVWHRPNAVVSWDAYLGPGVAGTADVSPYAAPARATDLTGLPPAYVSAMHLDPLRDEGVNYALALLAAGVTVELHLFPGTFHGSVLVGAAAVSQRELAEQVAVLRHGLRL